MDYTYTQEWEVLSEMYRDNPGKKSVKQIAAFFSTSLSNVYKWAEPDPSGTPGGIPKKYIVPLCKYLEDYRLLDFYASQLDCHLAPDGPFETDGQLFNHLLAVDEIKGHFSSDLKRALQDGRISIEDAKKLRTSLKQLADEVNMVAANIVPSNIRMDHAV